MSADPSPSGNAWAQGGDRLRNMFLCGDGNITVEVGYRALAPCLDGRPRRVLDLGAGDGRLAVRLAAGGHEIVAVDSDCTMIQAARDRLSGCPNDVARRITLVQATAESMANCGEAFDLVCCHSVLMYHPNPEPLLQTACCLAKPNGTISIISLNPAAAAFRAALQQRWREALAILQNRPIEEPFPTFDHPLEMVVEMLRAFGWNLHEWHGLGIFTDHYIGPLEISAEDFVSVIELETEAGRTDPYRSVARCYHLLSKRTQS